MSKTNLTIYWRGTSGKDAEEAQAKRPPITQDVKAWSVEGTVLMLATSEDTLAIVPLDTIDIALVRIEEDEDGESGSDDPGDDSEPEAVDTEPKRPLIILPDPDDDVR